MKLKGPYVTLVGGLAVAGVLLALSTSAARKDEEVQVAASAAQTAENATTAPEVPAEDEATQEPAEDPTPVVEPTPPGTYAGEVKGGGASVAIVIKGDTAIAYVCDGKKVEAWFQGSADTDELALKGKKGAALDAEYAKGRLTGTVKAAGEEFEFNVKTVKAPSGLYRAARNVRQAKVVGGWVVYEGRQVGMLNTDGVETPAPPIDLETGKVTIDDTSVQTDAVDGSTPLE